MKLNCSNLPIDLKPELKRYLYSQIKYLDLDTENNQLYQQLHSQRGVGYILKLYKVDNGDVFITALVGVHIIFDVARAFAISTGLVHQTLEHSLYVNEEGQSSKAFFSQWQKNVLYDIKGHGVHWDISLPHLFFNEALSDIYSELRKQLLLSKLPVSRKKRPTNKQGLVRVI